MVAGGAGVVAVGCMGVSPTPEVILFAAKAGADIEAIDVIVAILLRLSG